MDPVSSKPFIVVVGFDFSEGAQLAFEQCLELVEKQSNPEIHVVYVIPPAVLAAPLSVPGVMPPLTAESFEDAGERLRNAIDSQVAKFGAQHGNLRCRIISHVRADHAAAAVAQLAADLEADLLVVGTHGNRGLWRWLLGSVAQSVVALAPCPVLVVRPKRLEAPSPAIQPPCRECVAARRASRGTELWCAQHRERHGRRHTYHQGDRTATESNFPLVMR